MNRTPKIRSLLTGMLATGLICSATLSYADDTEIFFGGPAIDSGIRPNVLFVLDNSGSMAWRTDSNDNPSGGQSSRMTILKGAFSDIIQSVKGINAGVMVLNSRTEYDGTRMVFPVENIDDIMPSSVTQVANAPELLDSVGDGTERTDVSSAPVLDDPSLVMGYVGVNIDTPGLKDVPLTGSNAFFSSTAYNTAPAAADYACNVAATSNRTNCKAVTSMNVRNSTAGMTALLLIKGVNLPPNATIQSAVLQLTPTNSNNGTPPQLSIRAQRSKTPADLNDDQKLGSNRTFSTTATRVTATTWKNGSSVQFNVLPLITDILATNPVADPIGDVLLAFRASQNNDYTFCASGCPTASAPRLIINYTTPTTQTQTRVGAMRFENVSIPQGATVTSARLDFVPASSSSQAVTFQVKAQLSSDAPVLSTGEHFANRTKTTALTNWQAPEWITENPPVYVDGPDVTGQVQEVVNQTGWCGNNSMAFFLTPSTGTGSRTAYSYDGGAGLQPRLTISYTGGESGCLNPILEARVTDQKNDAYESRTGGMNLAGNSLTLNRAYVGARYEGLALNRNANILDARVILTPASSSNSPNASTTISFEAADNSAAFTSDTSNLSNRNRTSTATCNINNAGGGWTANTPYICRDAAIKTSLQAVVNRNGWQPGNAVTLLLNQSSDTSLSVRAYETNPSQSIKLRIKVANGGLGVSTNTVRNHLDALVQNMTAKDGTPIVPTYLEATQYLRGERSGYSSPMTSACQATHVVILTDGQANNNTNDAKNAIGSLIGKNCTGDASDDGERCARSLAGWLSANDQSAFDGDNYFITHTVGFALDASGGTASTNIKNFLRDVASQGKGSFYTATDAAQLSAAFNAIIQQVLATDTTFVSVSAPVNSFNRADNKDELYYSLFKPSENDRWAGNVKRYRFATPSNGDTSIAQIVDADGTPAIDANTGFFRNTARSFWSATADGNNTAAGGSAAVLPLAASRHLYTYTGSSPSAPVTLSTGNNNLLDTVNTTLTAEMLGAADATERTNLISYIRGINPADSTQRRAMGDPLHSSPRLATWSCNVALSSDGSCGDADQSVVVASNEGFLHVINSKTGVEQMAFMPKALLSNIKPLYNNTRSTSQKPRPYGLDNTVTLWVNDANNNGVIYGGKDPLTGNDISGLNTGEFVYAYVTMGRGGRDVYALDITDRSAPRLMWQILGGTTTGFSKLGQTWSAPVKTQIQVGTAGDSNPPKDVLIFAGGYDVDQDNASVRTSDDQGNALYIVDAKTGALIWSASNDSSATKTLTKMNYSMPGRVRVLDLQKNTQGALISDSQQLADQIFIGDLGGQVWRFYINNGSSGTNLVTPGGNGGDGVFANIVPADTTSETAADRKAKLRRFYNEVDVALLNDSGTLALAVNVGSGYRGHPLDKNAQDRFYSFRTQNITKPASGNEGTITEGDLYDASANLVQKGTEDEKAAQLASLKAAKGWYIKMNSQDGEKVLTRSVTLNGKLFFNTYQPTAVSNSCQAAVGLNRSYEVNILDATPTIVNSSDPSDRYKNSLANGGLAPDPVVFCQGSSCYVNAAGTGYSVVGQNGSTTGQFKRVLLDNDPRSFWIDQTP
ncbi:pilus assembly protein PilY [Pseudomonas denitrificans (nom. rej.)]|nr:pilus assembly protein PilY [Pseudomonas denitrificans (nom. rej.)]